MNAKIVEVNDWLPKENYDTKREIALGLIKRISNFSLLEQTIRVLISVLQKDSTYSRSQCYSSLIDPRETNLNKVLLLTDQDETIEKIWNWFECCSPNAQATFIFHIIKIINDYSILYQCCILARTILNETKENKPDYNTDINDIATVESDNTHFSIIEKQDSLTDTVSRSKSVLSIHSNIEADFLQPKNPKIDFVAKLPVHLAKKILNILESKYLGCSMCVNKQWRDLVKQVMEELHTKQEILEEAIMMQGASSRDPNSLQIKTTIINIPLLQDELNTENTENIVCCKGSYYKQVEIEERPIYIGSYNVLIIDHSLDSSRVAHYSGGESIVTSSTNKNIRLFDVSTGYETQPHRQSHSGSVTSIYVTSGDRNIILTGSYDTTIRSWHPGKMRCQKIMYGHYKSVTSLKVFGNILVSGGNDGLVKVWNYVTGKCGATFTHTKRGVVTSVCIYEEIIGATCDRGTIKVWNISNKKLIKILRGHVGAVTSLTMDKAFVISGGMDGYVITWFKNNRSKKFFKCYRHPKAVFCVQVRHLNIISGCEDGKIRILHLVSGECLRVLRGNSKCEPILSISATPQRLVVNTLSTLILLQFEEWTPSKQTQLDSSNTDIDGQVKTKSATSNTHSYVRAHRRIRSAVSRASCHSLRPQTSHTSYTLY